METQYVHDLRGGQAMAAELPPGLRIRVVDPSGGQLGAMMAFAESDPHRVLSLSDSLARAQPARGAGAGRQHGLLVDELILSAAGDELMRITADTMAAKGICNAHALQCSRAAYSRSGGTDRDRCQEALMLALDRWDIGARVARGGILLDALDLFAKAQDISLEEVGVPDHIEDDGNWQELGLPLAVPGDYMEFEILMPCLLAISNCLRSGGAIMKVEFLA